MNNKLYNVGIYTRLSKEDTRYNDNVSIENQIAMLSDFITHMPGWVEKRIYIDKGASGGNFNREGFQDMMEDVREGIINLVLVKDLSRFGRNYLEAGHYLEEELPALGCRFVALADGIDTETGENDILPFLNAINDFYLKDLSDRIKLVLAAKAKEGQKLSGICPYGYDRAPDENTRLIIDDYAAGVVRRIFELRVEGLGYAAIAGILNKDGILPPRLYYFKRQNRKTKAVCTDVWTIRTVKLILNNEIYIGNTVSFKRGTRSYRNSREMKRDESEWIKVENTHIPLVDETLWKKVQKINQEAKNKASNNKEPKQSLFSGLLICPNCNTKMGFTLSSTKRENGKVDKHSGYVCRTFSRSGRTVCSSHKISERHLKDIVIEHVKEMASQITNDKANILKMIEYKLIGDYKMDKYGISKRIRTLGQQLHILDNKIEKLYENKVEGLISAADFSTMINEIEKQRLNIESELELLNQTEKEAQNKLVEIDKWVDLIKTMSTLEEVDREMLENLIDKIEVGERKVLNGELVQDIRIFYKHIGLC